MAKYFNARIGKRLSSVHHLEHLESRCLLAGDTVVISEFMASNQDTIADNFGNTSDWIELRNETANQVDLSGWALSDDPDDLVKWKFPADTSIPANGYLLVWASDQDTSSQGNHHTNFKLSAGGDFVALSNAAGQLESSFGQGQQYPQQETDVSYGTVSGSLIGRYFSSPTPGTINIDQGPDGYIEDTKFSVDRGYFDSPFQLELTTATPDATLVYTLDGSPPSPSHGTSVHTPGEAPVARIEIDATTTVRVMAFRDGWEPTNIDTQTYLFLDQVIRQTGDGLPNTWGHAGADYEMDPEIVDDPKYRDNMVDGLRSLPSLSLVTDIDNWFDRNTGIYPQGSGSERPVSAELLTADGTEGFQVDGSVEIAGGSSTNRWKSDKLSMQLKFKREYGDANLDYPLFGDDATDQFDTLIIDARLNQAWHYGGGSSPDSQRTRAQYARDQYVADLQNALGGRAPHGQWVHVYLNGIYWGIHNLHERPDEHFAATYFGGDADDYDVIKHNDDVVNGSINNYRALLNAVDRNLTNETNYQRVLDMLDTQDLISYMLVNYYVGNEDWAHHNWYATFNKVSPDGRWRYHSWDAEHVLKDAGKNVTGRNDSEGPTHVHNQLMTNEEYRLQFMDAVQQHLYGDGLLTPGPAAEMYQHRIDQVYEALVPESARWGDNHRSQPFTRDAEWAAERDRLLEDYFPNRTATVISQLRGAAQFHRFDAPEFNTSSGQVESGFQVSLQADSGEIFYTIDGQDPRTSQQRYTSPIAVDGPVTVKARSLVNGNWSSLVQVSLTTNSPNGLRGDFSSNGQIDVADIDLLFAATREGSTDADFDLNEDQSVDALDATVWIVEIAKTRPGDSNLDGNINFSDFLALSSNFGLKNDASWQQGDYTGDGAVGFDDFLLFSGNFGFIGL